MIVIPQSAAYGDHDLPREFAFMGAAESGGRGRQVIAAPPIGGHRARTSGILVALDQVGVVALDVRLDLSVVAMTNNFRDWLSKVLTLGLNSGRLRVSSAAVSQRLRSAMKTALDGQSAVPLAWVDNSSSGRRRAQIVALIAPAAGVDDKDTARIFFPWPRLDRASHRPLWHGLWRLTKREVAVAELLLAGADGAAVASRLGITRHTVKYHLQSLMTKTSTTSRTQLVALLAATAALPL